jgi:hypothetical protein
MYDNNEARMRTVGKEYQESVVRLNAMCRVYSQADKVLTGDPINVNVVEDGPAPAWSDGKDIYINKSQIGDFDIEELVGITGLNYHELAHHLYTPRRSTALVEKIIKMSQDGSLKNSSGYTYAFNALEDQRIETLLVGKYPSVIPYLTNTVVRWLGNDAKGLSMNYLCIRGRRYLPLDLRIAFRDQFIRPDLIPVIAEIVDKYRTLVFPKDYDVAAKLIKRFKEEVLDQLPGLDKNDSGGPNNCGSRSFIKSGRPDTGEQQAQAMRRGANTGDAEPHFEAPDTPGMSNTNNDTDTPPSEPAPFIPPKTPEEALAMREAAAAARAGAEQRRKDGLKSLLPGDGYDPSVGGVPDKISEILSSLNSEAVQNQACC